MSSAWQRAAEAQIDCEITHLQQLGGGDFAAAYCATLATGAQIFIKTHSNPPAYFFSTEANGLAWLRQSNTVKVPQVLAFSDDPPFLALEWIDTANAAGGGSVEQEDALGLALAALHRQTVPAFGRKDKRTTGSLALPNEQHAHWADFYASQRLLPLASIAAQRKALPVEACSRLQQVAEVLERCDIAADKPSLLHGDLWAGNRLVDSTGNSWLIDPAAHCGHREFDLSMMLLFGGYSERTFAAYHEAYPLIDGFKDRVPIHQLSPLVVHAIKFGGSYVQSAHSAIKSSLKLLA